ncbi:MAG: hypothetical protein Q9181_007467 [Wetmoreana brouardii]
MSTHPPRLMARNGGVLKIPASATQARPSMASAAGTTSNSRLKLVIRRLPPGLSQAEFESALDEDWQVGSGKVDWTVYKPGKVSKDPAKPSKPSRAYLNLTKQEYINPLLEKVRETTFHDAKASFKDPVLLGPPSVEFAPYGKAPHTKVRKDARQGTIDQDQEFIDFLESLTNPVAKPTTVDQQAALANKSKDKVTTTPLIQYLKDKKANKGKEAAAATPKSAKHARQSSKDAPSTSSSGSDKVSPAKVAASPAAPSPDKRSAQAIMVEKAARDAARILNKQITTPNKPQSPSTSSTSPVVPPHTAANSPLAEKKRERGSASAAANILRRDLGIGTSPGARGGRRGLPTSQNKPASTSSPQIKSTAATQGDSLKTTDTSTTTPADGPQNSENTTTATTLAATATPTQAAAAPQPPTGPAASRGSPKGLASPSNATSTPPKASPVTPTATQAFLKHANPSQGITEPVLEAAFTAFGAVNRVEIDKKKGSAYVDFEEPEGLQKAIKASPVKVAQGQVVVLERRIGPNLQGRNVRGGPMMNNRGAMDARGGKLNHRGGDIRGSMMNNRGGGIPVGPRGGGMRGRGGFVRGANMPVRPARTTIPQTRQHNEIPVENAPTADNTTTPPTTAPSSELAKPEVPPSAEDPVSAVDKT